MENYNPKIHHRRSIRLKGYDYSQEGMYFITICTQDRECLFGNIVNRKMILNDAGKIADKCWLQMPDHFPNVILHEHVVMPNHVHGIIELNGNGVGVENVGVENVGVENVGVENVGVENVGVENVGVENFQPLPPEPPRNEFQKIIPCSIGSIIRGYKIGVTKWFRYNVKAQNFVPTGENIQPQRIWQRNYYEHIIRSNKSYQTISDYIVNNPEKWNEDKFSHHRNTQKPVQ